MFVLVKQNNRDIYLNINNIISYQDFGSAGSHIVSINTVDEHFSSSQDIADLDATILLDPHSHFIILNSRRLNLRYIFSFEKYSSELSEYKTKIMTGKYNNYFLVDEDVDTVGMLIKKALNKHGC